MGGDATLWNEHVAALEDRFTVVRYDIIGHGRSATAPGPWRYTQFARQLAELLDHLRIGRAIVCGFSLGGNIAQCFALEHPTRIVGLIVVSSACARTPEEQAAVDQRVDQVRAGGPPAVVEGAMSRWFGPEFAAANPGVIGYWRAKTLANDPTSYLEAYRLYVDNDRQLLSRLPQIRAPTLILTGDMDRGQTPRMAREMQRRIAGAELIVLPGIYHMLPVEAARPLASAIAEFAARRAGGS
jgi:pimeloyl-ACP methyl ester carboxylesterase